MKKLVSICTIIVLCLGILSGCGQKAEEEESIVKLVWDGKTIEVTSSQWDEKAVQISTKDTSLGKDKVYDFVGVKLIFPISDHPELSDDYDTWSWMWYVDEIEFVK